MLFRSSFLPENFYGIMLLYKIKLLEKKIARYLQACIT